MICNVTRYKYMFRPLDAGILLAPASTYPTLLDDTTGRRP